MSESISQNSGPSTQQPLWAPSPQRKREARMTAYMDWLGLQDKGHRFEDYPPLWQWSVDHPDAFWKSIWEYFKIESPTPWDTVLERRTLLDSRWFTGAQVNYTQQVFTQGRGDQPAIIWSDEAGVRASLSWQVLEQQVASLAFHLRELGVGAGDRVVAWLPNRPEAVIAFLACASIGAIWSICSPDMGQVGVLDRFSQIEPKVLIACDGYRYGGKYFERGALLDDIRQALTTLTHTILIAADSSTPNAAARGMLDWRGLIDTDTPLAPAWLPFDHPLWIVYSSGTTGIPKPIVHGHGGIILSMSVVLGLHNDLGASDRYHWYTSTGWIMWNCQISGLLLGSTLCLFDGNPGYPDLSSLWRFAADSKATFFGAGAAFYASCLKADIHPDRQFDLSSLRSVGSTGSPLSPECYEWIYQRVGDDIWLTPMSGGTDLAGPFIGGVPILPVYAGEMQCRVLGAAVEAFDEAGNSLIDEVGELVCTQPMPNMPLYFWKDANNERYLESYFDLYPGIWRHGDWIRITPRGGAVIYGRSDATINRHGIRMGTSELYRAVEALPEILDCLVVDLEYLGRPSYMPLFIVLKPHIELDQALRERINSCIRTSLSARHVPNDMFVVAQIPRTHSGKKLELPIKRLLMGQTLDKVVNRASVANPESLAWYAMFAQRLAH